MAENYGNFGNFAVDIEFRNTTILDYTLYDKEGGEVKRK